MIIHPGLFVLFAEVIGDLAHIAEHTYLVEKVVQLVVVVALDCILHVVLVGHQKRLHLAQTQRAAHLLLLLCLLSMVT